ncbi:DUF1552 domain-containing protein [Stratiformator vulcanicus]|uniref:DUF1552 domain-containing protein n=1 Tax=Stratiformator vulcanicus TaxID=2527980 RepID=A0A517QZ23_9PLAN|nr:DUF1552 domain-containing protein [Stratiformator vulcanicus]QDT36790.1 hypothetical protein Pan189_11530 [Stratiformator vulcanicus]
MIQQEQITRRFALQGLGASLALPWLPSLAWAKGGRAAEKFAPPKRWAYLMMSNGVNPEDWWAEETSSGLELSKTLSPLNEYKNKLVAFEGLNLVPGSTPGAGHTYFTNFLAGSASLDDQGETGQTIDQLMADVIGQQTAIPAINLGIEPPEAGSTGSTSAKSTISWRKKGTPVAPEVVPRQAFDRLFNTQMLMRDTSVLDVVLGQSKQLERQLGLQDRKKLDDFMTSVRDVEKRIERISQPRSVDEWQPTLSEPDMDAPKDGLDFDLPTHVRLMLDIMALAFQTDKTRLATLLMAADVSYNIRYNFIPGIRGEALHGISHHGNKPDAKKDYQIVNEWHVKQYAYLLKKLDEVDEGGQSILDSSMIMIGSNMFDGHIHDYRKCPLVMTGGAAGAIKTGRVLNFKPEDKDRAVANLWLSQAQAMGVEIESFGNSTGTLRGL